MLRKFEQHGSNSIGCGRGKCALFVAVVAVTFVFSHAVSAQESAGGESEAVGTLHGVVFGPPDNLPVEGVTVEVDGDERGETNADGAFEIELPAGSHRLRLVRSDRRGVQVESVEISTGETTELIVEFRAEGPPEIDIEAPGSESSLGQMQAGEKKVESVAEPGMIEGVITSLEDGEPVAGAQVLVRGADAEAKSDKDGTFTLQLPPGAWDLSVIHAEYSTGSKQDVRVESGESTKVTYELTPAAVRLSAYTVTIPKIEGGTIELTEKKRKSAAATEVIGAEQFSKTGDSTAAGALKRVTGLTVVGGKYVYVRGLGSRYASSLLNGSTLPSPEPEKRVVPLDLFPTSILESVTIQKTYTPDMPGNFGGGVVRMNTRSYPDDFSFGLGLSMSGDTQTTFQEGLDYAGGGLDWLGVDDGTRQLPSRVEKATDGKALSKKDRFGDGNYTSEELEEIGEALPNTWNIEKKSTLPNIGVSGEIGDKFTLPGGTELGFLFAGTYDMSHDVDVYSEKTYLKGDGELQEDNSYDFRETTDNVVTSAILSGGAKFDENNKLKLTSMVNRVTDDETRRYQGFYSDHGGEIRVSRLRFLERQLMFHQLHGTHTLPGFNDLEVEWRYVFSQAKRDEPDRRLYRYDYEQSIDAYALTDRPSGNNRLWSKLRDNNHDGGFSAKLPFRVWNELKASAEVGFNAVRKDRVVDTRRFKFFSSKSDYDLFSKEPETVFSEENIGSDSFFELREVTRPTDNYTGAQTVLAGYAMAEIPIIESLKANAGARIEHSDQRVETFALFSDEKKVGRLATTDVLPALNLTWSFAEKMQVRAAASRTVNRPNFRELSSASFTGVVGGRQFQGNPDLDRATINHLDTRWEWYPERGESVSVGAFYKDFQDPIEITFEAGATPLVRPANIEGARNLGLELQGRTNLDFITKSLRDLYVAGNLSLIESQIEIDPDSDKAELLTNTERPLQGQSPYVINGQLSYDNVDIQTAITLLYNVYGPRISEVGIYGIPDIKEQPFHTIDLTFSKKFENGIKLSAKAQNLLNLAHRYTQGGKLTHKEYEGRSFSMGVSYSY